MPTVQVVHRIDTDLRDRVDAKLGGKVPRATIIAALLTMWVDDEVRVELFKKKGD